MTYIKTPRLTLAPFEGTDAEEYFKVISDDQIRDYVFFASAETLEQAKELVDTYTTCDCINDFYLKIIDNKTSHIIGGLIAAKVSASTLDVSYFLNSHFVGNGYMTEVLKAFVAFITENTSFQSIEFQIRTDNVKSFAVAKSAGAKELQGVHPFKNIKVLKIDLKPYDVQL